MKKVSLTKLLSGVTCISPMDCLDLNKQVSVALKDSNIAEDSVLFLTRSIGESKLIFDASALKENPYAIITDTETEVLNSPSMIISVSDVRLALAYAYSNLYEIDYDKLKIIGVTGTNGKTTVATLIYSILMASGYRVGFIGTGKIMICEDKVTSDNYSMTTPDPSILYNTLFEMQSQKCDFVVMEVSSHSIALNKIAPIKFEYSIFTNLSSEHMDFHKSMEDYFTTKLRLFSISRNGLFNLDDKHVRRAYDTVNCPKSSIGIINSADAYVTDVVLEGLNGSSFYYRQKNLIFRIKTSLCGAFNIYNCLMALRCVIDLGIKPCIAKRALEEIESVDGRMEIIRSDIKVIIDYAHTPQAVENCLKSLYCDNVLRQNIVVVFGCGGDRDKEKRSRMGKIASEYCGTVIITEDNSRTESLESIISDISEGIEDTYIFIKDRADAIRYAILSAHAGDTVAILGKGHEKYIIKSTGIEPFDEKSIVRAVLDERELSHAD